MSQTVRPVAAVLGVIIYKKQVLLVRRLNPPDAGLWGFPGGKIDAGESIDAAVVRRVYDETGLIIDCRIRETVIETFDYDDAGTLRYHYLFIPVICTYLRGQPVAAWDVCEARWFSVADLRDPTLSFSQNVMALASKVVALANR